jgi:hypothetical protein
MVLAACNFFHDVINRDAIEPLVSIPRVVAAACQVYSQKTSQAVKPQFPLKYRKGKALKILVCHSVDGDHGRTS